METPFKFLNAFESKDYNFYFGREQETRELFQLSQRAKLILFFGLSGTGKTSLVRCGLANQFKPDEWDLHFIRRNEDINKSLELEIEKELKLAEIADEKYAKNLLEKITTLYRYTSTPLFLVFDQFEELFILGHEEEQKTFYQSIHDLLSNPTPCKIMILIREEFLGQLWNFEKKVRQLFDFRFRMVRIEEDTLKNIVIKTLNYLFQEKKIYFEPRDLNELVNKIVNWFPKNNVAYELTYLQMLLTKLYQSSTQSDKEIVTLKSDTMDNIGGIDDLFDTFIDGQLKELGEEIGRPDIPLKVLGEMITSRKTKKILSQEDLDQLIEKYDLSKDQLNTILNTLIRMGILLQY